MLFGLEFIASALIVLLFHQYSMSPGMAIAWGVPLTVALSLIFSFFSFHTFSRFVNFAPTLLAVLIFEVYEYVRHESILGAVKTERNAKSGDHETKS
jgi:hypothetical protein